MSLHDRYGQRKYLTPSERQDFIRVATASVPAVHTFCATLAFAGCRISEALALTADRVDISDGVLIFESLKKRRRGIFRAVPVPPYFLETLCHVHEIAERQREPGRGKGVRLWTWSRATAWRRVSEVMRAAGIAGLHATPKGIRHGFGIKAVTSDVPLNMAQKWLGHSRLSSTAIYTNATGPEEKQIARRMWT